MARTKSLLKELWQSTGYIFIVEDDMNDIGTTTLLKNRENSQILSFYLFSLASLHQGY